MGVEIDCTEQDADVVKPARDDVADLRDLTVSDPATGRMLMRFGLQAQLYFTGGETRARRHAFVDAAAAYQHRFASRLHQFQKEGARRMTALTGPAFAEVYHAEVETIDPETGIFGPHVTDNAQDPRYQLYGMLTPANRIARDNLSYLRASAPVSWVRDNPADVVAQVLEWCDLLKPQQGTVGIAPLFEAGMDRSRVGSYFPFLTRFPGLDFFTGFIMAAGTARGLHTVNWLTVLDDAFVADCGGTDALAAALPGATLHVWDGGLLIQAGALPVLGDVNAGVWPQDVVAVNRVLRPLRFEDYPNSPVALIKVPAPLDAYEETLKWVRRFDREG